MVIVAVARTHAIMPRAFKRCASSGGRVRTKSLSKGRYIKVCFKKSKSYAGHVEKKKKTQTPKHPADSIHAAKKRRKN